MVSLNLTISTTPSAPKMLVPGLRGETDNSSCFALTLSCRAAAPRRGAKRKAAADPDEEEDDDDEDEDE